MGKPAARMGDQTAHGGVIAAGAPTVLIGGKPAARMGDMHTCPMLNPGVPPPPHVGAAIVGGVPTVLICGQPAACVGDMVTCSGPPDSIVAGEFTVLIGPGGGGGAPGMGGGSGATGTSKASSLDEAEGTDEKTGEAEQTENHFLDVSFVDKGGFPVTGVGYKMTDPDGKEVKGTLTGRIEKQGIETGDYEIAIRAISNARWSAEQAKPGDKLTLTAKVSGIEDGTRARITILVRDFDVPDQVLTDIESKVQNKKVSEDWVYEVDDRWLEIQTAREERGGYSSPRLYFKVETDGVEARSRILRLIDDMEIMLKDGNNNAISNRPYKAFFPNGEVREGKLDKDGKDKLEKVPPGKANVSFGRGE